MNPYTNEDVYNMDESVLFWKMTPDGTLVLSKELEESPKKPGSPLILHAMLVDLTNLGLGLLGKAVVPRCLGRSLRWQGDR